MNNGVTIWYVENEKRNTLHLARLRFDSALVGGNVAAIQKAYAEMQDATAAMMAA